MKNTFLITTLLATTALASNAWAEENYENCTACIFTCGTNCKYKPSSDFKTITIYGPSSVNSQGTIDKEKFKGTTASTIVIKGNIRTIDNYAFQNAKSIVSLTLPDSVRYIGSSAFKGASKLTSINIPYGVTQISDYAFASTNLASLTIPDSVTKIGSHAFDYISATSLVIPESVTQIGSAAFSAMQGKIYCPESSSGQSVCSVTAMAQHMGSVVNYTKDNKTGVYTTTDGTFASAEDMQNEVTCSVDTGECAIKVAQAMAISKRYCTSETACGNLLAMVASSTSCAEGEENTIANCSTYVTENQIDLASWSAPVVTNPDNGNAGSSTGGNGGTGEQNTPKRRIYTVQEATDRVKELGTDTVNFRIRYK